MKLQRKSPRTNWPLPFSLNVIQNLFLVGFSVKLFLLLFLLLSNFTITHVSVRHARVRY